MNNLRNFPPVTLGIFQSTLLQEERHKRATCNGINIKFQSTLLQEERPVPCFWDPASKVFQSTLLQEERLRGFQSCYLSVRISIHAPTRGATLKKCTDASCFPYFNPRSYKRSDVSVLHLFKTFIISIHAPTRGATSEELKPCPFCGISIHAPTRGATFVSLGFHYIN